MSDVIVVYEKQDYNFTDFVRRHEVMVSEIWEAGHPLPLGKVRVASGFRINLGEVPLDQLEEVMIEFIEGNGAWISELRSIGATGMISVLIGVGGTCAAAICDVSLRVLKLLCSAELSLTVVACAESGD